MEFHRVEWRLDPPRDRGFERERDSHAGQVREASIRGGWRGAQGASRSGLVVFGGLWGDHRGSSSLSLSSYPFPPSAAPSGAPLTLTPSRPVLTKAPETAPAASTSLGRAQTETYAVYADAQVDNNAAAEEEALRWGVAQEVHLVRAEEHEKTSAEEQRRERNRKSLRKPS